MARTVIPVTDPPRYGGMAGLTPIPVDATNGHEIENTGRMFIIAQNIDNTTAKTFTVRSVRDEFGRLGDLAVTVAQAPSAVLPAYQVVGPLRQPHFNSGSGGLVVIDSAAVGGLRFYAFKFQD